MLNGKSQQNTEIASKRIFVISNNVYKISNFIFLLYRFYIRIFSHALEKLQIPDPKKQVDPENIFKKMLPWCEIWTTLLRAQGKWYIRFGPTVY